MRGAHLIVLVRDEVAPCFHDTAEQSQEQNGRGEYAEGEGHRRVGGDSVGWQRQYRRAFAEAQAEKTDGDE